MGVSVKFKGFRGIFVSTLGLLKLPSSGTTTVHAQNSVKNKKELAASRNEYLKAKKEKKKAKWAEIEKEGEKEKGKWQNFSKKAFGKKGFVKKSIFKTPEQAAGKVGVGTMGIGKGDDRVQRRAQVQEGPMIPLVQVGWGSWIKLVLHFCLLIKDQDLEPGHHLIDQP